MAGMSSLLNRRSVLVSAAAASAASLLLAFGRERDAKRPAL